MYNDANEQELNNPHQADHGNQSADAVEERMHEITKLGLNEIVALPKKELNKFLQWLDNSNIPKAPEVAAQIVIRLDLLKERDSLNRQIRAVRKSKAASYGPVGVVIDEAIYGEGNYTGALWEYATNVAQSAREGVNALVGGRPPIHLPEMEEVRPITEAREFLGEPLSTVVVEQNPPLDESSQAIVKEQHFPNSIGGADLEQRPLLPVSLREESVMAVLDRLPDAPATNPGRSNMNESYSARAQNTRDQAYASSGR